MSLNKTIPATETAAGNIIEIKHLTKDYGQDRGIFDVSFSMPKGEVLGFLGANGAGKTTTIRHLMGFIRPEEGYAKILGQDCFQHAPAVQRQVGYLPGEIALMDHMTGLEFIRFIADMKHLPKSAHTAAHPKESFDRARELMDYLELNGNVKIKKMSKGMKQKTGLVLAFMQDAPVLILDEPTSGLDPLMQNKFIELIKAEKKAGKTILMSSHIFEEVEHSCDHIVLLKSGKIMADETIENIRTRRSKHYEITFAKETDALAFAASHPAGTRAGNTVYLLQKGNPGELLRALSAFDIADINARPQTLEELFLQYYGGDRS